ncbi:MAG: DUF362 domain-containing protein [Candidatus Omnitrophota bacterium]
MKKFTRREFLQKGIGLSTAVVSGQLFNENVFARNINLTKPSLVSIAKGKHISKITQEAIQEIGGMDKIVKPGQTVFIKPNYIAGGFMGHDPVTSGEIPHPEVVAAVACECLEAGAKNVLIGEWFERPLEIMWQGKEGKEGAQLKKKIDLINKKYGNKVYLIDLRKYTESFFYVPSLTKIKWLAIPNLVKEADVIISIAVLKTHHYPISVTFGMKNFVGIMPSILYGEPRMKLHQAGINQIIVDIIRGITPSLTVISGVFGMEGEGVVKSFGGISVDISQRIGGYIVIAGVDPVATDAIATRIITENWHPQPKNTDLGVPWYIKHLRLAYQQGLGNIKKSNIIIKGAALNEVKMPWKMPQANTYPELPNYV